MRKDIGNMKKFLLFFLFGLSYVNVGFGQARCELFGEWKIISGNVTKNYKWASTRNYEDKLTFTADTAILESGFFYSILNVEAENYALNRYPFVFYGKKEHFQLRADTLFLRSSPYNKWNAFKIGCIDTNNLTLIAKNDTVRLTRANVRKNMTECRLKFIKAHVFERDAPIYNVNYQVKYFDNDQLLFQQLNGSKRDKKRREIKLPTNYFKNACRALMEIDLMSLQDHYQTDFSEVEIITVDFGFSDGTVKSIVLENDDYPEKLRHALVPILYGHQKFLYGDLKPIDFRSR
ncbi:MAG TPA: hypothetical protein VGD65_03255 [Chryseosolibacter sp.]